MAVLLMVFAPLEAVFNPGTLRWWDIAALVALAVVLGYWGMLIEETR